MNQDLKLLDMEEALNEPGMSNVAEHNPEERRVHHLITTQTRVLECLATVVARGLQHCARVGNAVT